MKKTTVFIIIAVFAVLCVSAFAIAAGRELETGTVAVSFIIEFTTPVELPEGYGVYNYDGAVMRIDGLGNNKGEPLDINNKLMANFLYCMGDAVFEGWDKDLDTYVCNEDTVFYGKINNDGCVPAFFKTVDESGQPVGAMQAKLINSPDVYDGRFSNLICFRKQGEKLEGDKYLPVLITMDMEEYVYDAESTHFTPEPDGYVMNEPTEFVCKYKKSAPEDVHKYTITFKAEFTTPMELPEGYSVFTFDELNRWYNSVLSTDNFPRPRYLGDGMKFLGWDTEIDSVLVTENMTFTAKFDNDGCVPVFFKSVDEDGEPIKALGVPDNYVRSTVVAVVKAGETLAAKTVPTLAQSLTYPEGSSWDENPIGYKADETKEFTYTYKYYYRVRFIAEQLYLDVEQYVHRGEAAKAPEIPADKGYLFISWDKDFSKVTEDMTVTALMYRYGDVNLDNTVNTLDAAIILRQCAGITKLEDTALTLADANCDGKLNTADAVKVLKIVAGMEM